MNSVKTRVAGFFPDRLSGLRDFLPLACGRTILDIGSNRGLVAFEFARYGAALIHGCDIYVQGTAVAEEIFKEVDAKARFEAVNLADGTSALIDAFGSDYLPVYDIVLFLGVYHHLAKTMPPAALGDLTRHLINKAGTYFVCRTPRLAEVERLVESAGLEKVHFSNIAVGPMAIWRR